jgi:hypothetical protein
MRQLAQIIKELLDGRERENGASTSGRITVGDFLAIKID